MSNAKIRLLSLLLWVAGGLALVPAHAQINFRAAGAQAVSTGASLVPAIPAGTQAGDLAVLMVAGRPSDTSQPAAPAGWTLRSSALREVGARDLKIVTYYRLLTGGDANPTLTVPSAWQGGQAGISGQIVVWSGVSAASPFDAADVTGTAAATSPWTPPAITTVTAGARVISAVASADDNALGFADVQGFTLRMSGAAYDTTSGGDHSVGVGDKDQPTAGAVIMPGWGQTANASDAWVGISFALKPADTTAALYFIHTDHLNTPRLIANNVGQAVWQWENTDPFGNNAPNENPEGQGTFTCNLRLPGQYFDKETNLHYNMTRDYSPDIGRYTQSDPIGLTGGINTYTYVKGNPLSYSDPTGLYIPGVHASISYTQAMGTCLQKEAGKLGSLTAGVDTLPGSQLPGNSIMHSMCPNSPISSRACQQMIDLYIERHLEKCTLDDLALALHAIQDGFASGHGGGQIWPGMPGTRSGISWGGAIAHFFGDLFPLSSAPANATKKAIVDWCNRCGPCRR